MRLKYNPIHIISTMPCVHILILDVNKVPNRAYNWHWNIMLYNCDFRYFRCFSKTPLRNWLYLHYQNVPLQTASKYIPDDSNSDTYQYTILVDIYVYKSPEAKHNAQNNSHTYCNTSETKLYFDFFCIMYLIKKLTKV